MKISEYKGNKVLKNFRGRLASHDATLPDCMCDVIWTDKNLLILEDNYDGTYEEHFVIPINMITNVEFGKKTEKRGSGGNALMSIAMMFFGAFGNGGFVYRHKEDAIEAEGEVYEDNIRIAYIADNDAKNDVYLVDMGGDEKKFVAYWKKHSSISANLDKKSLNQ